MRVPEALGAVLLAETFLRKQQTAEGLWPDFVLEPGPSQAWTTAVVACALAEPPVAPDSMEPLRRAGCALHHLFRREGWGYNSQTAADADSTAWAVRFLGRVDDLRGLDAPALLRRFLDGEGAAHTFGPRGDRFGRWAAAHADVTPVVGLALLAVAAPSVLIGRVRAAALAALRKDRPWESFWWATDAYAVARNLEFLEATGGVPERAAAVVRGWLATASPGSSFEAAQLLACAHVLAPEQSPARASELLARQRVDGSWPSSPMLLVPAQHAAGPPLAFADSRRCLTAALAVVALKRLLQGACASREILESSAC